MNILQGVGFHERVFNEEEKTPEKELRLLTGRKIASMIYEHFRISDADVTVLDISGLLNSELRGDSEQTFDTVWDETIIAMLKQLHGELLDNSNFMQLEESDLLKHLVALHIQDTVRKSEPKSYTKL